jgi:hypothetical protein
MKTMPRHLLYGAFLILVLLPLGSGCITRAMYDKIEPGGNTRLVSEVPIAYVTPDGYLIVLLKTGRHPFHGDRECHLRVDLERLRAQATKCGQVVAAGDGPMLVLDHAPLKLRSGWPVDPDHPPADWRIPRHFSSPSPLDHPEELNTPYYYDDWVIVGTYEPDLELIYGDAVSDDDSEHRRYLHLVRRGALVEDKGLWVYPLTPVFVVADTVVVVAFVPLAACTVIYWCFDPPNFGL